VMRVNVFGVACSLAHALDDLRDGAAVVAVASLNSWRGDANIPSYVASKHAVLGIVRSAALELGRRNIRVNAIAPGPIATDALIARMETRARERGTALADALEGAAALTALGRIATVEEVARVALFLASDLSSGLTGHLIPVDGGLG
jgi:3alpha(or 20beta)-hydroxysteroid dehydrogenase